MHVHSLSLFRYKGHELHSVFWSHLSVLLSFTSAHHVLAISCVGCEEVRIWVRFWEQSPILYGRGSNLKGPLASDFEPSTSSPGIHSANGDGSGVIS